MLQKFIILLLIFISQKSFCQDTFSIVALDSTTRHVASAGASCLDLFFAGYTNPAFLADIIPDTGAINTQSYYIQANQDNARARMRAGDTPSQIVAWLIANCANNNPEFKQYGIVGFNGHAPSSAAHSGSSCINYKNHITGSINGFYYAIQGNILKGQEILDSMEAGFRNTSGNLACKVMAAMQGAKVIGADTRCANQNTSSLFAFLQVAKPTDVYGSPSINLGLMTANNAGIEPIDSLQKLFDAINGCNALSNEKYYFTNKVVIFPNPAKNYLQIVFHGVSVNNKTIYIYNIFGKKVRSVNLSKKINKVDLATLPNGYYAFQILEKGIVGYTGRFVKEE